LFALALTAGGCSVATRVSIDAGPSGSGTVTVSVTLDSSALAAVGGLAALRADLIDADLGPAGWKVTGPAAAAGGGASLSAWHPFSSAADLQSVLAEVAGPGVFRVSMTSNHGFWRNEYRLSGQVDLSCGLNCFGDSGLLHATGSSVGVQPGPLESATGSTPATAFTFTLDARLPGALVRGATSSSSTASLPGSASSLVWNVPLGGKIPIDALTRVNTSRAGELEVGGASLVTLLIAVLLLRTIIRRRRPARLHARRRFRIGRRPPEPSAETVTPPS
jgi:hypothetical protein